MELYQSKPFYIDYNEDEYNFRKVIEEILEVANIEQLHKEVNYNLFDREHDQSTVWHRRYYDNFEKFQNQISDCYNNSVQNIIYETENILDKIFHKEKIKINIGGGVSVCVCVRGCVV